MALNGNQSATTLVLVPTEFEMTELAKHVDWSDLATVAVCGFGPVEAASVTATLISRLRPQRVLLLGIAGTYDVDRMAVGSRACFGEVAIDGIGAGSGDEFIPGKAMGFTQETSCALHVPARKRNIDLLLTCCAASANAGEVKDRLARFPNATAEDMEGFGVARACQLTDVPLAIVRGISNAAGNRDRTTWRAVDALAAAGELAQDILRCDDPWELAR